jgi:tetratricopeptide (TPR) repeat protein
MWVVAGALVWIAATSAAAPAPRAPQAPDSSATPAPSEVALRAYAQGRLLEMRGAYREAIAEYYRAMVQDHRSLHIARHVADLASRLGDFEHALEYVDRALRIEPDDPQSLWIQGSALFSMGRAEESLASLQASVARDSSNAERWRTLGRVAEFLDRVPLVERAHAQVVELEPDDGESWFQLAAAQARLGKFEAADRSLREVADHAPPRPGQLFLQAWVSESLGRLEESVTLYRHHLEIHPADLAARRRLVHALAVQERWKEALVEAQNVARAAPDDFEARMVEVEVSFQAGRAADGIRLARRLAAGGAGPVGRAGMLAALLVRHRRASEAIRMADEWRSAHAGDPEGALLAARIRALAGQAKAAIPIVLEEIEASPDSLAPRALLGRLYVEEKRHADAERVYREARTRFPGELGLALELADCLQEKGDIDAAEAAARDALRIAPDNPRALNFLGYLLADHNRRLEESEQLILRAVAAEPDNGAYVDSLGWVYYRLGRLQEARTQLERAVDLTDGDPVVREHLGDVYRDLDLRAQARDQYRLSLASDASNARVRAKLAETAR